VWNQPKNDSLTMELFLQGQRVPCGTYKRIDGPYFVSVPNAGLLPAALDGNIACYMRNLPIPTASDNGR
jgi:hypothetical protein